MSGPLVRFEDTRAACPYQKTAHSMSCHVRISEISRALAKIHHLRAEKSEMPVDETMEFEDVSKRLS